MQGFDPNNLPAPGEDPMRYDTPALDTALDSYEMGTSDLGTSNFGTSDLGGLPPGEPVDDPAYEIHYTKGSSGTLQHTTVRESELEGALNAIAAGGGKIQDYYPSDE